jgi:prefoldin subunit 5
VKASRAAVKSAKALEALKERVDALAASTPSAEEVTRLSEQLDRVEAKLDELLEGRPASWVKKAEADEAGQSK